MIDGKHGDPAMANFHCVHKVQRPEELEDEKLELPRIEITQRVRERGFEDSDAGATTSNLHIKVVRLCIKRAGSNKEKTVPSCG